MPIPNCPLSDEHCQLINQALESCHRAGQQCSNLEQLGIDVSQLVAENDANRAFFTKLKAMYFPDHP